MSRAPRGWFVVQNTIPERQGASSACELPGGHELRLDLWQGDWPTRIPEDLGPVIVTDRGGATAAESATRKAVRDQLCQQHPQAWLDVDPRTDQPAPEGVPWILSRHFQEDTAHAIESVVSEARERGASAAKVVLPSGTSLKRRLELLQEARLSEFPCVAFAMSSLNHADRLWAMELHQPWGYLSSETTRELLPGLPNNQEILQRYCWDDLGPKAARYLILGRDVRHSLSPDWHNRLFADHGIEARFYPWSTEDPEADMCSWTEAGFPQIQGMAVTAPHKSWARKQGTGIDRHCESHTAWNTLVFADRQYRGTSTDGAGALDLISSISGNPGESLPQQVAILGRGGAAQSVATTLKEQGMNVVLHCRPGQLQRKSGPLDSFQICDQPAEIVNADLLINATGSDAQHSPDWPWSIDRFQGRAALEMDYSRGETAFERELKQNQGIPVWSGFDFFASQARLQARHFHGLEVSLEDSLERVRVIRQQRQSGHYPTG